jgi:hypothetical protein
MDGFAAVSPADADVVEAAEVAEGDLAGLVDAIVADAEVGLGGGADGVGAPFRQRCELASRSRATGGGPRGGRPVDVRMRLPVAATSATAVGVHRY